MANKRRRRRYTKTKKESVSEDMLDFYSRCVTESIFYLTPYILLFIILGIIFS